MDSRQENGGHLATHKGIRHIAGAVWLVPSQAGGTAGYVVDTARHTCSCPDYELRLGKCKHQWAVEVNRATAAAAEARVEQAIVESVKVTRQTYAQNWSTYNAAQCDEKADMQDLLRALCDGIHTPPHPGRGPKPALLSDIVYGLVMKVYSTVSGRRASTDIRASAKGGHITKALSYNVLFKYMDKEETTPLLQALIKASAEPLAGVESDFAVDATGFGTVSYTRWYDHKYGREMKKQGCAGLLIAVGGFVAAAQRLG